MKLRAIDSNSPMARPERWMTRDLSDALARRAPVPERLKKREVTPVEQEDRKKKMATAHWRRAWKTPAMPGTRIEDTS